MNIEFSNGSQILKGVLDISLNKNARTVIYFPGMNFKFESIDFLAKKFMDEGYNFFRFQLRYHENNNMDDFCLNNDIYDTECAIKYLTDNGYIKDCFGIIGKSFGGLKTFLQNDKRIKCVGLYAPAVYFSDNGTLDELKNKKYGNISKITDFKISNDILNKWTIPTILIHSTDDKVVNIGNSQEIYNSLKVSKKFIQIDNAGHSFGNNNIQNIISSEFINFFKLYL